MSGYTAIVPVKPWALAKGRLALPQAARQRVARAFTLDVLDVLQASDSVRHIVIVSAERELLDARGQGVTVLEDRPLLSCNGLNKAIFMGRYWALSRRRGSPVVVVPADLPALDTESLEGALRSLGGWDQAFIPDAGGTGTTLLAASCPIGLRPMYGDWSAKEHLIRGARAVDWVDERARCDIDTVEDLVHAQHLGLGSHTAAALRASPLREG